MNEFAQIVTHYLATIARRAGLRGFEELRAELEAAADKDIEELERRSLDPILTRIEALEREVSQLRKGTR